MLLAVLSVAATSAGRQFLRGLLENEQVKALIGSAGMMGLVREAVLRRFGNPWTFLLLVVLLALLWSLLQHSWRRGTSETSSPELAALFVYLIAGVAFLLTLAVEFVYLRDLFGTRMNTVFKFYYQAWVMMAIAAAFGSYYLLGRSDSSVSRKSALGRYVWLVAFAGLVLAGMIYPVLGIPNKAGDFKGKPTLDGMAFLQSVRADDYAAIQWLQRNVQGMAYIVEATGGSYSDSAFASAFTGLPTILGWDFHQYQWRGNTVESGKRQPDIAQIYQSTDSKQVLALLDKYDVEYVYVGPVEKRKYELPPNASARMERFLELVYEGGEVRIYRRR
jgi:YYY domain-containing protein